jgi:hypothetical protein
MTTNSEEMIKVHMDPMRLPKSEYSKMENLAKELGMMTMTQYRDYCMDSILESHSPEPIVVE